MLEPERLLLDFVELEADFFVEPLERLVLDFVELEADFLVEPLERLLLDFEAAGDFFDVLLPVPEELLFVLELFRAGRAVGLAACFFDPDLALDALLDFFVPDSGDPVVADFPLLLLDALLPFVLELDFFEDDLAEDFDLGLDFFVLDLVLVAVFFVLDGFAALDCFDLPADFELPAFASFRLRVAAALRAESEREAFFAEAGFFVPPPPSLSPPPLCLFTVAHARLSASFSLTPLSS